MNMKSQALGLAGGGVLVVAATAAVSASPASAQGIFGPCTHGGLRGECSQLLGPETLWEANNTVNRFLQTNDQLEVECWYTGGGPGRPKDFIWDHVVWVAQGDSLGSMVQGHVDDNLVDFGGETPGELGLPHCG